MRYIFILILIAFIFFSCQEEYINPDIDGKSGTVVIEGVITNNPDPYVIKISYAESINTDSIYSKAISGAKVSIEDENGIYEKLTETIPGEYKTNPTRFVGKIGQLYKLSVLLEDGTKFESEKTTIMEPPTLDSMYCNIGKKSVLVKDGENYVETSINGINVDLDISPVKNHEYYYSIETHYIDQQLHLEWIHGRGGNNSPISVYCRQIFQATDKLNLNAATKENSHPLLRYAAGFIPEFKKVYFNDSIIDPPSTQGFVATSIVRSYESMAFDILENINKQTNPSNTIFDPLPTSIESNISCTSERKKNVIGYFIGAGEARKTTYIYWSYIGEPLKLKYLNEYPSIVSTGCYSITQPPDWIEP